MQDDRVKVYSYNRRRIKYIFVMVCIAATVIIGRLAYIMVLKAKYYSERADNLHPEAGYTTEMEIYLRTTGRCVRCPSYIAR